MKVDTQAFAGVLLANLCWCLAIAAISWFLGLYLFRAMHEQTQLFAADSRFQISDLLILAAQLQVAAGLLVAATPRGLAAYKLAAGCGMFAIVAFWWWSGVRMLGTAGIAVPRHRWLFLGIVMPAGYLASLWIAGMVVTVPASLLLLISSIGERAPGAFAVAVLLIVMSILAIAGAVVCQRFCERVVERARMDRAHRDGIEFLGLRLTPRTWGLPMASASRMTSPDELSWLAGAANSKASSTSGVDLASENGENQNPRIDDVPDGPPRTPAL